MQEVVVVEPGAPGQRPKGRGRPKSKGKPRSKGKLPGEGRPPEQGVPRSEGPLPGAPGQVPVGAPGQVEPGAPGQMDPHADNPWATEDWDGVQPPSRPIAEEEGEE